MTIGDAVALFTTFAILALIVLYYVDAFLSESRKRTHQMREQNYRIGTVYNALNRIDLSFDLVLEIQRQQMMHAKQSLALNEAIFKMHTEKHSFWLLKTANIRERMLEKQNQPYHAASAEGPDEGASLV